MHVVLIISNHGELWRHFPVVASYAGSLVMFGDHRNSIFQREDALTAYLPLSEITSVERVVFDPINPDCANNVHAWEPITVRGRVTGGRCSACGYVEELSESVPAHSDPKRMAG